MNELRATHTLSLSLGLGAAPRVVEVDDLVVAGWTGRDQTAVEKHIKELEELGVRRPSSTPIFYEVAASRLTTAPIIEVSGENSSGEVEFILLAQHGRLWVGLGSDHTDRGVEAHNVTASKQMCEKPIGASFWAFDEVKEHWDKLTLRSWIRENGADVLYQEGTVASMRPVEDLLRLFNEAKGRKETALPDRALMFGGTFAVKGGIRNAAEFSMQIEDPVLGRTLSHRYALRQLANVG